MIPIGYRNLVVALIVIDGLACASPRAAAAVEPEKPATAAGTLKKFSADAVVLESPSQVATFDAENGLIVISTRQDDRREKRAEASFDSVKRFKNFKSIRSEKPARQGIEVYGDSAEAEFTLLVDDEGIFEFKPGKATRLILRGLRFRYGMVPSLVGTDFLYDAKMASGSDRLNIPSLNMVIGLVDGEDCMAVGVWPRGDQSASLGLKAAEGSDSAPLGKPTLIDSFTFDTAGRSFYFSCLAKTGIWHCEPLKRAYLERDTVIDWKRPFVAKWIGRFFITSDSYDWPFYFNSKPKKTWGRYIRGWYKYPVRFDGERTVIHFEKQFLPQGDLLIYCLEPYSKEPDSAIGTPAQILANALGKAEADKILDRKGTVEQTLMEHGMAVCAMTDTMQGWVDKGKIAENREQILRLCDDTSSFIRMIRERDQAFAAFARDMNAWLAAEAKARPKLAAGIAELQESITAIGQTSKNELPTVALETVRQWTDSMKKAAEDPRPDIKETFAKLGEQCRSVAGTQDDLARTLSIQVIRLTEQAARIGVQSPEYAKLAEEVIVKSRQLLRKPTWWEPIRHFNPESGD